MRRQESLERNGKAWWYKEEKEESSDEVARLTLLSDAYVLSHRSPLGTTVPSLADYFPEQMLLVLPPPPCNW